MPSSAFDPVQSRERLLTRLHRLDPGIIRVAAPIGGCEVRAGYISQTLAYVHAHLKAMLDDVHGNLNLDVGALERRLDELNEIGDEIDKTITNRCEAEKS